MNLKPQMAADGAGREDGADRSATGAPADSFVINLCSSTTPMALAQPDAPELKRFRFFVSRRLEDRRERFRLHMGYFASLEEAEEWLGVVRDVYPGAWAGEAPGKRLRARAAAALPASPSVPAHRATQVVAPPAEAAWEATSASSVSLSSSAAAFATPGDLEPTAQASLVLVGPSAADSVAPAVEPAPPAPSALPGAARAAATIVAPLAGSPPAPIIAAARNVAAPAATAARAPSGQKPKQPDAVVAAPSARPAPLAPLSNVREVLAALDERGGKDVGPLPSVTEAPQALSDTQVMKILEERRSRERVRGATPDASSNVPMLRPEDTGTRRALKEAVQDNSAVSFAVQLQWSVQPMALDKVPPLAIFSAYTLYTVEGNREGRKWYGLRLGFFSDADSAKQVAHYVRSEFTSVAVLPVSAQERGRATQADLKTQITNFQERARATDAEEITLLDNEFASASASARESTAPMRPATKPPSAAASTASPAARAAARSKKLRSKAHVPERKAPSSLEETLEILGADALEIDNGRGEFINERGVRHLSVEVHKNSPFARLLTRLTERVRKS